MENNRPLEKQDFLNRLYDTFCNFEIFLSVIAVLVALAPLIYVGFLLVYFLIVFIITVFLVIFTIGLIFTVENNIVVRLWSTMDKLDVQKAVEFQSISGPIILGIMGALMIALVVGFVFKMNKTKSKAIAAIVVGGLAFLLLFVFVLLGGGVQ